MPVISYYKLLPNKCLWNSKKINKEINNINKSFLLDKQNVKYYEQAWYFVDYFSNLPPR